MEYDLWIKRYDFTSYTVKIVGGLETEWLEQNRFVTIIENPAGCIIVGITNLYLQ